MLKSSYSNKYIEAGCDEAGRGCLAGPVFAAAVILPKDYKNSLLDDSKKLSEKVFDIFINSINSADLKFINQNIQNRW